MSITKRQCKVEGCKRSYHCKGFCGMHNHRFERYGDATIVKEIRTHGMSASPEYKAWRSMRIRCYNNKSRQYINYGARGITICQKWLISFANFYRDMGPRPSNKYSIERIDVNGNYEPSNCKWATAREQCNNKRNNVLLTFEGKTQTIAQWSRDKGLRQSTIWLRLYKYNWTLEKTLTDKLRSKPHYIIAFGQTKTMTDWAIERDLKLSTICGRIKRGASPEKALYSAKL